MQDLSTNHAFLSIMANTHGPCSVALRYRYQGGSDEGAVTTLAGSMNASVVSHTTPIYRLAGTASRLSQSSCGQCAVSSTRGGGSWRTTLDQYGTKRIRGMGSHHVALTRYRILVLGYLLH